MILIGVTVPSLVGIVFADYFILGLRYPEVENETIYNVTESVNPAAIIAWVAGAGFSQFTPLRYMPAVLAVFAAAGVYVVMYKLDTVTDVDLHKGPTGEPAVGAVAREATPVDN